MATDTKKVGTLKHSLLSDFNLKEELAGTVTLYFAPLKAVAEEFNKVISQRLDQKKRRGQRHRHHAAAGE